MSCRVEVSRNAEAQIEAAADWWLKNRPKAPAAFAEEVEISPDSETIEILALWHTSRGSGPKL